MIAERWLPVVGFEGAYEVSDLGNVRSLDRWVAGGWGSRQFRAGRTLRVVLSTNGYPVVSLGKRVRANVHRLVMAAFVGPYPPGFVIRHLDGDSTNAKLSNLAYGSCAENEADKVSHGTHLRGERNHQAKLDADLVREIRARRERGETLAVIARAAGVSVSLISQVVNRNVWRHVP